MSGPTIRPEEARVAAAFLTQDSATLEPAVAQRVAEWLRFVADAIERADREPAQRPGDRMPGGAGL